MKIKCPVAGCGYTVKGADDGFKHFQNYDEFHKALHWNWLKYFFPEIAKSDMPDTVKFRLAYKKWHEDQKKFKEFKKKYNKPKKDDVKHFDMDRLIGIHH